MSGKTIVSSATSDLVSDQRVHRICSQLTEMGYEVTSIGRQKSDSQALSQKPYATHRISTWFEQGPLFYAGFNLRLLLNLLFRKTDILWANDLDTLLANYVVSKIKGVPLIYDSHEFFTEVPELKDRVFTRKCWMWIEKIGMSGIDLAFTVSAPIASAYTEKYDQPFHVLRNFPNFIETLDHLKSTIQIEKQPGNLVILYQGSVNVDRGLEEMITAMEGLENCQLVICGEGDILDALKNETAKLQYADRISFLGKIPFEQLSEITQQADLGLSIEKQNGLSYAYALPNKFFDYIQAGLPSIISALPEMKKINDQYHVAVEIEKVDVPSLQKAVKKLMQDDELMNVLKQNAIKAGQELNWQNESKILTDLMRRF